MNELLPILPGLINKAVDSIALLIPEIYLAILFLIVLATDLLFGKNSAKLCRTVALAGLLLIIFKDLQQFQLLVVNRGYFLFGEMLLLRRETLVFKLLIDVLSLLIVCFPVWDNRLKNHRKRLSDLYTVMIASIFGLHIMCMATNLLSIYLSVEMVSIASYLLVAYRSESGFSAEAGLKYVLFGAAASAIMLYGISLLYAFGGSLELFSGNLLPALVMANPLPVSFALILVMVGIGFKLSFVPMQFWVPDVYQGAPTPVTAYLSVLPKIAGFSLLINFLTPFIFYTRWHAFNFELLLSVAGVITMIAGNFAALRQNNVKRMLAYSSIGHTGFALMAVVAYKSAGITPLAFYLGIYALANIGALMLVNYLDNQEQAEEVTAYRGLGFKYPLVSVCFVVILVSLTGLPVTAGFNGKLLVFSAVYGYYGQTHQIWLLILLITGAITTVVSLFYYIRVPLNLFLRKPDVSVDPVHFNHALVIAGLAVAFLLILFGVFPGAVLKYM
jgi:NADH-quinone oxidoreductase subunit N